MTTLEGTPTLQFSRDQIELVAKFFYGEPNKAQSSRDELRFGRNGSKSINLRKCLWYDHEEEIGGDTFALIKHVLAADDHTVFRWLDEHGVAAQQLNGESHNRAEASRDLSRRFRIVKTWSYTDEAGTELFEVCRKESGKIADTGKPAKTYVQRHKTLEGFEYSIKGIRQVPYRLPELIEAIKQGTQVFITEGEKCADAIIALGGTATCNAMGAGKWPDELLPFFRGAEIVVLADNYEPGGKHGSFDH